MIKEKDTLIGNVKMIFWAFLVAMLIRTILFQPFTIPSGSMLPTLLVGDYLFVSKYSYGYSNYSIPFNPQIVEKRILSKYPKRGDVAVFKLPSNTKVDYIKRIVGLPGDKIQVINGKLTINDKELILEKSGNFNYTNRMGIKTIIPKYKEYIDNNIHDIIDVLPNSKGDNTQLYIVPEGHYFMMGDNRDNSLDSRFMSQVGYVPYENFLGKAEILFFSIDKEESIWKIWRWPSMIRWNRILMKIT
jgi:signal peptidase I